MMLDAERLKHRITYDPATGVFTWRTAPPGRRVGALAGSLDANGYWVIRLDGAIYYAHRLAVLYMTGEWPVATVDHKNEARADNRWTNIRPASWSQNLANRGPNKNNTSGAKGVWWSKRRRKWLAAITVNRKARHLGYFPSVAEASAAYAVAAKRHFGAYARTQ
jgi:hypothetical protein